MVHQSTHYTQGLHYKIPSDWVVHNSLSGYIDHYGWLKVMSHFSSVYFSSPLNPQSILYHGHGTHFDYGSLNIFWIHYIQYFILKASDSVHDHPNNNGSKLNLKNMYGNARMNCMSKDGTLKFTPAHINAILV